MYVQRSSKWCQNLPWLITQLGAGTAGLTSAKQLVVAGCFCLFTDSSKDAIIPFARAINNHCKTVSLQIMRLKQ